MKQILRLGLGFIVFWVAACTVLPAPDLIEQPTVPSYPALSVQVDASGAIAWLDFCEAQQQGQPWDESTIRQMVDSPPYQALIAHHKQMDSSVTSEAMVILLLALRDDKPWNAASERLNRIHTAYGAACDQVTVLRSRLELLQTSLPLARAMARAQEALPSQARVEATVYLLADGRSSGYVVDKCIVLDVLQALNVAEVEAILAHELHHMGASSMLPEPCPNSGLKEALETLTDLVQEGAATYWIDNQRLSATQDDLAQVEAFLRDVLSEHLSTEEIARQRQKLVQGAYGPLYRVGNEMIAALVSAHGRDWVQARLGDPVGLFRIWQTEKETKSILSQEILTLLDQAEALGCCPKWFQAPEF